MVAWIESTCSATARAMLIDYKTGNADKLKQRVAEPLEDTQLAFYAALLTDESRDAAAASDLPRDRANANGRARSSTKTSRSAPRC